MHILSPRTICSIQTLITSIIISTLVLGLFVFGASPANAQDSDFLQCTELGLAQSLRTDFSASPRQSAKVGETVEFPFTVTNVSERTIAGTDVFAVVYPGSPFLPDAIFQVAADVTLHPGESHSGTVSYTVPAFSDPGMHMLQLFTGPMLNEQIVLASATGNHPPTTRIEFRVVESDGVAEGVVIDHESFTFNGLPTLPEVINYLPSEFHDEITVGFNLENTFARRPVSGTLTWRLYEGLHPHPTMLVQEQEDSIRLVSGSVRASTFTFNPDVAEQYTVTFEVQTDARTEPQYFILPLQIGNPTSGRVPSPLQITGLGFSSEEGNVALIGCLGTRSYPFEITSGASTDRQYTLNVAAYAQNGTEQLVRESFTGTLQDLYQRDYGFRLDVPDEYESYRIVTELIGEDGTVFEEEMKLACDDTCKAAPTQAEPMRIFGVDVSSFIYLLQYLTIAVLLVVCIFFLVSMYRAARKERDINGIE